MTFLDQTIGALFIGIMVSVGLWGVSCAQAWSYYRTYPRDALLIKVMVAGVLLADVGHQILCSYTLYRTLITDFASPLALLNMPKALPMSLPFALAASTPVQAYFAWRIWIVSHGSYTFLIIAIIAILVKIGFSIAETVIGLGCTTYIELNTRAYHVGLGYAATDGVCDVLITTIMCWLLHSSRTEHRRTNSLVDKLMLFAVTTGFLTSLTAVTGLIIYSTTPSSTTYLAMYFILSRLYVNSLLASLNMRATLQRSDEDAPATQLPTLVFAKRSEARASEEEGSTVVGSSKMEGAGLDGPFDSV